MRGVSKEEANKRAEKLLDRVGINDQIDKYPSQLSSGRQQRVAIARALAMELRVMMIDEATSALDPEMIKEVRQGRGSVQRTTSSRGSLLRRSQPVSVTTIVSLKPAPYRRSTRNWVGK